MLKGIHLTLLIGPAVPMPAPQSVIDALTSVQVTSGTDRSGFQLTFAVSKKSPLLKTMLPAGYFDPMVTRVIIIVTLGGVPNVLMDGIVTRQEMQPSNEPGQSTLTITGEDLSVLMDVVREDRSLSGDAGGRADLCGAGAVRRVRHRARSSSRPSSRPCRIPTEGIRQPGTPPTCSLHQDVAQRSAATCSTSSPGRCPGRASPTSGPTSASRFRSRR